MLSVDRNGTVSGAIRFAARHVGQHARRVVFLIDGHRRWSTARSPFRFRGTGWLNTRTLSNGRHVMSVLVVYASHRERAARRTVVVFNRKHSKPPTSARSTRVIPVPVPAHTPPPRGLSRGPVSFLNRETYDFSSILPIAQEASRYQVIVLQSTNGPLVAQMRAANPNLRVLMYMDPMDSNPNDPSALTQCTSYLSDVQASPTWFLNDQNGNGILYSDNTQNHIMDVGDPTYQQACVARAIGLAKQYGFSGIFWDDIETEYRWVFGAGITSAKYPTQPAYYGSFLSFVSYAGAAARAQGLVSVGNISAATPTEWQQLNSPLDGAEEESFTDGGAGLAQQIPFFAQKLANAAWSEANGKLAILHSYNTTETGNTYGLASMLLIANGHSSYSTSQGDYTTSEFWYPEYTTAQSLGAPTNYLTQISGAYERPFQNGIVVVNPTGQSRTVTLPAGTYSGSNVTVSGSVTVPPLNGDILLRVG